MNSEIKQCVAAKAIIRDSQGRILVLRQSNEKEVDGAGRYHPPGGIVEPGETLRQTLVREVNEETKLVIDINDVLSVEEWHVNIHGDDCYFVGIFFACTIKSGSLDTNNEEVSGLAWVSADDLEDFDILEPSKKVIKAALSK